MIQNPPDATQFLEVDTPQESQVDLRKYLAVLFKYKWAIVSIALLAGLIVKLAQHRQIYGKGRLPMVAGRPPSV